MPSPQDRSDWLVGELQKTIATFDDDTSALLQGQQRAFELRCELLREDVESVRRRSKSNRSTRLRARTLLGEIFESLGAEVFLLCALGPTITKLGDYAPYIRLSTVETWWRSIPRVRGLVRVATELCEANAIAFLAPPAKKPRLSDCLRGNITYCSISMVMLTLAYQRDRSTVYR
jgi:hypothetical protein